MPYRYHCRFEWSDGLHYGIVESYGPEAEEAKAEGKVLVACAVGPNSYLVPEDRVTDLDRMDHKGMKMLDCGIFWGMSEVDDFVALANLAHKIREDRLPDDGKLHVGHQFSTSVADGSANYVVVKVMKKNCDVEFRAWCADRWFDHHFGWGGRFSIADINRYVQADRGMAKLFAKKEKKKVDLEKELVRLKTEFKKKYGHIPVSPFTTV